MASSDPVDAASSCIFGIQAFHFGGGLLVQPEHAAPHLRLGEHAGILLHLQFRSRMAMRSVTVWYWRSSLPSSARSASTLIRRPTSQARRWCRPYALQLLDERLVLAFQTGRVTTAAGTAGSQPAVAHAGELVGQFLFGLGGRVGIDDLDLAALHVESVISPSSFLTSAFGAQAAPSSLPPTATADWAVSSCCFGRQFLIDGLLFDLRLCGRSSRGSRPDGRRARDPVPISADRVLP